MRYILSLALLMSACTRANPDAIGGNGGSGGGGGAAGSGGGGGGGTAGGGGTGGGPDLAMSTPPDMVSAPADMTSFAGVYCGTMICLKPTSECCAGQTTVICQTPASACTGRPFDCDGPEDCMSGERCCGSTNGSMCGGSGGSGCSNGDVPLCHTVADCAGDGYVACCGATNGGHLRFCSKQPCM